MIYFIIWLIKINITIYLIDYLFTDIKKYLWNAQYIVDHKI